MAILNWFGIMSVSYFEEVCNREMDRIAGDYVIHKNDVVLVDVRLGA